MGCFSDTYFWRQSVVLIADCIHSVGTGFMLTFPAVLNPAILSPNSTEIRATPDQASWIAASQGISGVFGFCLVPPLMQILGRKTVHIGLNFLAGIGFLIFALAPNITALYAGRVIQGLTICGVYVTAIMLGEYSNPKRRGYFITLKKASVAVGSLMCHSMSICWTWRQIAVFAIVPHIFAIIMTFFWRESPAFLAFAGRYEECNKSYLWLYGNSALNKQHVEELIAAQMERRQQAKNKSITKSVVRKLLQKDFLKPFIIVSLMTMIIDACGRYYMLAYIVQILIEITEDKSVAVYCTIGADALTIIALIISCFIIQRFKRRTLLFTSGITSVVLMFLTSFLTILATRVDIGASRLWVTPIIILLNVFIVNVGVIPACFAIVGEIFPLEHKGIGSCASGIVFTLLYAVVLKFTPLMMERTGVQGTFGIYGLCVFIGLFILYFVLNETKDKTLQEIENELKGIKPSNILYSNKKPLIDN